MAVSVPKLADEPANKFARSVTVWNDSGGVGKTTLTENISAALGRNDRRVLAIDLDPQSGGLTHHTGFEGALTRPKYKITDVLLNENRSLDEVIINGAEYGMDFDVIPAHEDLAEFDTDVDNNIGPRKNPMRLLREGIAEAGLPAQYDTILIDAPATKGKLVENAIVATRNVIIPTEPSPKGVASVDGLHSFVSERQRRLRRSTGNNDVTLSVIAVVPNAGAKNGQFANTEEKCLQQLYNDEAFDMVPFHIPSRQILSDAWEERESLYEFVENRRDLRSNEKDLPLMFEMLAHVIEEGTTDALDGYEGNLHGILDGDAQ